MTEVPDTWTTRELPVLRIAVRDADNGAQFEDVAKETGLTLKQVSDSMRALRDAGYVDAAFAGAFSGFTLSVTERARREIGSWPSAETLADQLARAFAEAAERESDPERKSTLRSIASGLIGAGHSVAIDALSKYVEKRTGLS